MAMTVSDVTAGQNVLKPAIPKPKPAPKPATAPRQSAPAPSKSAPVPVTKSAPVTAPKSVAPQPKVSNTGPISSKLSGPVGPQGGRLTDANTGFTTDAITRSATGQAVDNVIIPDAQSDPSYQLQISELGNALANFKANQDLARSQYDDQLGANLRRMGWNEAKGAFDANNMQGTFGQDFQNNEGDFASRGAFYSGPHLTATDNLNQAYNNQKTDMDQGRARFQTSQNMALAQAQQQDTLARQRALADAVSRIAAAQGVDFSSVPGASQLKVQ